MHLDMHIVICSYCTRFHLLYPLVRRLSSAIIMFWLITLMCPGPVSCVTLLLLYHPRPPRIIALHALHPASWPLSSSPPPFLFALLDPGTSRSSRHQHPPLRASLLPRL